MTLSAMQTFAANDSPQEWAASTPTGDRLANLSDELDTTYNTGRFLLNNTTWYRLADAPPADLRELVSSRFYIRTADMVVVDGNLGAAFSITVYKSDKSTALGSATLSGLISNFSPADFSMIEIPSSAIAADFPLYVKLAVSGGVVSEERLRIARARVVFFYVSGTRGRVTIAHATPAILAGAPAVRIQAHARAIMIGAPRVIISRGAREIGQS